VLQFVAPSGAPYYFDFAQMCRLKAMPLPERLSAGRRPAEDARLQAGKTSPEAKSRDELSLLSFAAGEDSSGDEALADEAKNDGITGGEARAAPSAKRGTFEGPDTSEAAPRVIRRTRRRTLGGAPPPPLAPAAAGREGDKAAAAAEAILRNATRAVCKGVRVRYRSVRFRAVRLGPVSVQAILTAASALGLDARSDADAELLHIAELALHSPALPAGWRELPEPSGGSGGDAGADVAGDAAFADGDEPAFAVGVGVTPLGKAKRQPVFEHVPTGSRSDKHPFELEVLRTRMLSARVAARMADDVNIQSLPHDNPAREAALAEGAERALATELASDPVTAAALAACGAPSEVRDGEEIDEDFAREIDAVAAAVAASAEARTAGPSRRTRDAFQRASLVHRALTSFSINASASASTDLAGAEGLVPSVDTLFSESTAVGDAASAGGTVGSKDVEGSTAAEASA